VRNNVLFDNSVCQLDLDGQLTNSSTGRTQNLPQANVIGGNVCYSTSRQQEALTFRPEYDYGTMAGNYFCNSYTDSVVSGYGTGNNYYTIYDYALSRWQQLYAWADKTAKTDPFKRPRGLADANPFGKGEIFINESPAQEIVSLGNALYKDLDGAGVTGSINLPAFSSRVLVRCDSTSNVKNTAAGPQEGGLTILSATPTRLQYRLGSRARFSLSVFDPSGRQVAAAQRPVQPAGIYSITLGRAGTALPRGVYYYVVTENARETGSRHSGTFVVMR
jgi:hypothetical protein